MPAVMTVDTAPGADLLTGLTTEQLAEVFLPEHADPAVCTAVDMFLFTTVDREAPHLPEDHTA